MRGAGPLAHPLPPWLRYTLCGCGVGLALVAGRWAYGGPLPLVWVALIGVAAGLAGVLLLVLK